MHSKSSVTTYMINNDRYRPTWNFTIMIGFSAISPRPRIYLEVLQLFATGHWNTTLMSVVMYVISSSLCDDLSTHGVAAPLRARVRMCRPSPRPLLRLKPSAETNCLHIFTNCQLFLWHRLTFQRTLGSLKINNRSVNELFLNFDFSRVEPSANFNLFMIITTVFTNKSNSMYSQQQRCSCCFDISTFMINYLF